MTKNPSGDTSSEHHTIKNADVPSETGRLPGAGEEASATHYLRDTIEPHSDEPDGDADEQRTRPPAIETDR